MKQPTGGRLGRSR